VDDEDARGCRRANGRSRRHAEHTKSEQNRFLHACKDCIRRGSSALNAKHRSARVRPTRVLMRKLLLTVTIGLALPGVGRAGTVVPQTVTRVPRDAPAAARSLQAAAAPIQFDMLGLHWQGAGTVDYRTRSLTGRWSAWTTADADLPQTKPPWHFGNLDWTGPSDAVQFRNHGVTHLRAYYLSSPLLPPAPLSLSIPA